MAIYWCPELYRSIGRGLVETPRVPYILEPEIEEAVPADIYEKNVGIWELIVDTEKIGREFRAIREKNASGG